MTSARFIGHAPSASGKDLHGETALIQERPDGKVVAQFDSYDTGYHFGWHEFPKDQFEILPSTFAEELWDLTPGETEVQEHEITLEDLQEYMNGLMAMRGEFFCEICGVHGDNDEAIKACKLPGGECGFKKDDGTLDYPPKYRFVYENPEDKLPMIEAYYD